MPPLTKEEKKARKEAKKQEKIRALNELKKKLRRDALKREIKAQALKRREMDEGWREMMLKIKEPVFKQDIRVMNHVFERVYDKKDCVMNHIIKLIGTADEQFQRTIASFCVTVDAIINRFLIDLEDMSRENDRITAILLDKGRDDAAKLKMDYYAAETHLQLLIYAAHTDADNLYWNTRGENAVKEDEDRSKYLDEREVLRSFLEDNYNAMWDEYKSVLKAYVIGTAENQKQVRKLRRKENIMADIIAAQAKKIANNDAVLKRLRSELAGYESGTKQQDFRDRRNRHRAACFKMKKRLANGCTVDTRQLGVLVKSADSALEWLQKSHKKGEKILRLAALCRKFETLREKVLPFGSDMPHSPTQLRTDGRRQSLRQPNTEDELITDAITSTGGLTRLWQRVAKAELAKRALIREKMLLEEENALIEQRIEIINDRRLNGPDTNTCPCNQSRKAEAGFHPVAVEGPLELKKYALTYRH